MEELLKQLAEHVALSIKMVGILVVTVASLKAATMKTLIQPKPTEVGR